MKLIKYTIFAPWLRLPGRSASRLAAYYGRKPKLLIIVRIIFLYILFYLLIRLVTVLLRKGRMYYRAYRELQRRRHEQAFHARREDLNLRAFDVEDARYEDIKGGEKDK